MRNMQAFNCSIADNSKMEVKSDVIRKWKMNTHMSKVTYYLHSIIK